MVFAVGVTDERFYLDTVRRLLDEGWLARDQTVLVVAGNGVDRDVMLAAGLRRATVSNLDERVHGGEVAPFPWSRQDAERLSFADGSFDVCIAHQALHHCRSPHQALLEMYRVARRGLVFFEPQETLLTRVGVRLGVGQRYEVAAVGAHALRHGGVANTGIPNFVYRWTEREVRKVLSSYDPIGEPRVRCLYDLRVPQPRVARLRSRPLRLAVRVAVPLARTILRLVPAQANALAVVVDKLDPGQHLHPWLAIEGDRPVADRRWFARRYQLDGPEAGGGRDRELSADGAG